MTRFQSRFKVGSRYIGHSEPCFIIAEAGVNHNGKLPIAKKLIDAAIDAGADAIKFQTFNTEKLVSRALSKSQYDMLKKLELTNESFLELRNYAKERKVALFSTPFDEKSVTTLDRAGVPAFKVSSGDLNNLPLLRIIAKTGRPIILSTGMSTMAEISEAVDAIAPYCQKLVLTHCTSLYPPRFDEINLKAMDTIRAKFGVPVGYSDHTLGYEISLAAVVLGACVIEKHLTLDKKMKGPDHKASLEPSEFADMVKRIRNIEQSLGTKEKRPVPREKEMRAYARKSITAVKQIPRNAKITAGDIAILRPGNGIEPKYFDEIIGCRSKVVIRPGEQIEWHMLRRK